MFTEKKVVRYFTLAVLLIVVVTIFTYLSAYFNNHNAKIQQEFSKYNQKISEHMKQQKEENIKRYIALKKENATVWLDNSITRYEQAYQESKVKIKEDLQETMQSALKGIKRIKKTNKKKSIRDIKYILSKLNNKLHSTDVFLANYRGDTLYGSNNKEDVEARTIILEEIQKVRRRGIGYIVSTIDSQGTKRHILVQDLGMHQLFIGVNLYEQGNNAEIKNSILKELNNIILDTTECLSISEGERVIFNTSSCSPEAKNKHYVSREYKTFNWKLTYSVDSATVVERENKKLEAFNEIMVEKLF